MCSKGSGAALPAHNRSILLRLQVVFALSRARRRRLTERTLGCRVHLFESEGELLRAALEYVKQQDPDALVLFQASGAWPPVPIMCAGLASARSLLCQVPRGLLILTLPELPHASTSENVPCPSWWLGFAAQN
jgi:hypothetical protein